MSPTPPHSTMLVLKTVLAAVNGLLLCVLVAQMITHVRSQNKIKSWSTAFHLVGSLTARTTSPSIHGTSCHLSISMVLAPTLAPTP